MDLFFRISTLLLFALWQIYWWVTSQKADREKPKLAPVTMVSYIKRFVLHVFVYLVVILQLFGLNLFIFDFNSQVIGFIVVLVGMATSVSARIVLDTNWAHAAEYQIKKNHELITTGIYKYIRHPIYTGIVVALIGAELVAKSYLFILFFVGFLVAYKQATLEERILEKHFGKDYTNYKKRSKMLIPFLF